MNGKKLRQGVLWLCLWVFVSSAAPLSWADGTASVIRSVPGGEGGEDCGSSSGFLTLMILPQELTESGVKWCVDGSNCGEGLQNLELTAGEHTVQFFEAPGWMKPPRKTVKIEACTEAVVSGVYIPENVGDTWATLVEGGELSGSPAVDDNGTVFFGSSDSVYALDATTRELQWVSASLGTVHGSPGVGPSGIYTMGSNEGLVILTPTYNSQQSRLFPTTGAVSSGPAFQGDGTLYFGSEEGTFYALDAQGNLKWQYSGQGEPLGAIQTSPVMDFMGNVYVGTSHGNVYKFSPDGTTVQMCPTGAAVLESPAIGMDGSLYVASRDGALRAVDPAQMQELWKFDPPGGVSTSPIVGLDGVIYVGGLEQFFAVHADGSLKWRQPLPCSLVGTPAMGSDGIIYGGCGKETVLALDSDTGDVRWKKVLPAQGGLKGSPILASDGSLYMSSHGGQLFAVLTSSLGPLQGGWPMLHHDGKHSGSVLGGNALTPVSKGGRGASPGDSGGESSGSGSSDTVTTYTRDTGGGPSSTGGAGEQASASGGNGEARQSSGGSAESSSDAGGARGGGPQSEKPANFFPMTTPASGALVFKPEITVTASLPVDHESNHMTDHSDFMDSVRKSAAKRIIYLPRAVRQMSRPDRMIGVADVRKVIEGGELVEDYPEDVRGRSCLLLGYGMSGIPIHVVCSPKSDYLAVITAYVPSPQEWEVGFGKRKRP